METQEPGSAMDRITKGIGVTVVLLVATIVILFILGIGYRLLSWVFGL